MGVDRRPRRQDAALLPREAAACCDPDRQRRELLRSEHAWRGLSAVLDAVRRRTPDRHSWTRCLLRRLRRSSRGPERQPYRMGPGRDRQLGWRHLHELRPARCLRPSCRAQRLRAGHHRVWSVRGRRSLRARPVPGLRLPQTDQDGALAVGRPSVIRHRAASLVTALDRGSHLATRRRNRRSALPGRLQPPGGRPGHGFLDRPPADRMDIRPRSRRCWPARRSSSLAMERSTTRPSCPPDL